MTTTYEAIAGSPLAPKFAMLSWNHLVQRG